MNALAHASRRTRAADRKQTLRRRAAQRCSYSGHDWRQVPLQSGEDRLYKCERCGRPSWFNPKQQVDLMLGKKPDRGTKMVRISE